ncbi:MAG: hypothetical protein ABI342_09360 [Nitrososphaera sp.]
MSKKNLVQYIAVPPDTYVRVKRGLQEDHMVSQYPSFHESMYDSFEIISIEGRAAIHYYKNGRLALEGDENNSFFRRIVRQVNKIVSTRDYL